jgi:hypothetical protein
MFNGCEGIMAFRDDFPEYEKFQNEDYYYTKVPPGVTSALKGLILRIAKNADTLKAVCINIATRVPLGKRDYR